MAPQPRIGELLKVLNVPSGALTESPSSMLAGRLAGPRTKGTAETTVICKTGLLGDGSNRNHGVFQKLRFMLDGAHFSWWMNDRSVLTVSSLFGRDQLEIEPRVNREMAAQQLAMQLLLDAQEP